eukprot:5442865-Prorocentrum_lima.AAC.1
MTAISSDERKGRMLLGYVGVISVTSVLAQLRQEGKCADEIVESVDEAVRQFCTWRRPTPGIN